MGVTATVRQAKLKPECADRYPTLPARMWTPAACLTELVASYRRAWPQRPENKGRTLSETDFEFRGGFPRRLGGGFARTRTGELTYGGRDAAYNFRAEPSLTSLVAVAAFLDELDLLN